MIGKRLIISGETKKHLEKPKNTWRKTKVALMLILTSSHTSKTKKSKIFEFFGRVLKTKII